MTNVLPYLIALVLGVLAVLYFYSSAVTTWYVRRSEYFDRRQKFYLLLMVWLLPIVGVALALNMLGSEVGRHRPGWIPLIESLILAMFVHSASSASDGEAVGSVVSESTRSSDAETDGGHG